MSQKTDKFINDIKNGTIITQEKYGILASVTMAQAILESGWGSSNLAKNYNNLFGIKADTRWCGRKIGVNTKEYINNICVTKTCDFRVYNSWSESIEDHAEFLVKNKRYKDNGLFDAKDYVEQIESLVKAGYSTSPDYSKELIRIIKQYNLDKFDNYKSIKSNDDYTNTNLNSIQKEIYGIVTASALNVRDGASINSKKIGKLLKGEKVHIFKNYGEWLSIYFGEHGGYVSSKYVKIIKQ
ncbi:N-acetylmuramoyl-L-alanine amidase [Clostridium botulinum D/C]|uniref:glucosaminidase domain-containing protein n=1 Tax=Clostridium botulinum TaxID=1491 RepID=UPI0009933687|nr:glucosaminidase domain-containing protein [Clostridium botulinum]OOV53060.1 N-acetylmuramoyl-L-alanine amidase [Clostridium botulinum D/C]OOV58372.1 N-acetylmuramoyl-L-alanine amidase [Clostridium botulinum D/C]OOV59565.1 N-acetylmuramoyl-L-alanine amidase [Clostridium botulinum D/C]